jgi:hypothetical protein
VFKRDDGTVVVHIYNKDVVKVSSTVGREGWQLSLTLFCSVQNTVPIDRSLIGPVHW